MYWYVYHLDSNGLFYCRMPGSGFLSDVEVTDFRFLRKWLANEVADLGFSSGVAVQIGVSYDQEPPFALLSTELRAYKTVEVKDVTPREIVAGV